MLAATHVIVPVETSILALDGLKILLTTLEDIREGFGHNLVLAGVLACRYDYRTRLSRLVLEELRRALPGKVFKTVIRENVRMRECPASGQSILTFAPESTAAADYRALAAELLAPPQPWRQDAVPATGQNSVENLRSNTSDKLLEGQRKAPPFALEVGEDELDPNQELPHDGPDADPDTDLKPEPGGESPTQPEPSAPAPDLAEFESMDQVPVAEDPLAMLNPPPTDAPATDAPETDAPATDASSDEPAPDATVAYVKPAGQNKELPVSAVGSPAGDPANSTDALAQWLDQLASAEQRIKQQESLHESGAEVSADPPSEPASQAAANDADPAGANDPDDARRIPAAPPESASHHTPTAPIPETRTPLGTQTTIPNMAPEPPRTFRAPASTPDRDIAVAASHAPMRSSTPGSNGKSAVSSELSMMEILAGVNVNHPQTPIPSTAGTTLPGLTDMPSLPAPTPPGATGRSAHADALHAKTDKPMGSAKPSAATAHPGMPANEKGKTGSASPGPGETGDNFPALRAYLKQMQKDGKLPAKPTPQTSKDHKGGGLRTFLRKVVGSKRP